MSAQQAKTGGFNFLHFISYFEQSVTVFFSMGVGLGCVASGEHV